jgi:hypothetical protein
MEGGAARRDWAAPVAPLAAEEVGKDEGLTGARFVLTDGVGRLSAVAGGVCRWSFCSGEGGGAGNTQAAQGGCRGAVWSF